MIHAAEQTQFKLPFIPFPFIPFFIEPFLQFAFLELPLIGIFRPLVRFFFLFKPVLHFPRTEFSFLFQLQQQTCCRKAVLSADLPSCRGSRLETSASEPAFRLQTFRRKRGDVLLRPQA